MAGLNCAALDMSFLLTQRTLPAERADDLSKTTPMDQAKQRPCLRRSPPRLRQRVPDRQLLAPRKRCPRSAVWACNTTSVPTPRPSRFTA